MFDRDLAELYRVETKVLNQTVKRNKERFPEDFMFKLNQEEIKIWHEYFLRSQFVTSKSDGRGGRRFAPYVFTEQGVAMLSSVLKSKQAVQVNIQIMRTFTKIREMLVSHKDLREKIEKLEKSIAEYDEQLQNPQQYAILTADNQFFTKYENLKKELENTMAEWERLADLL